MGEVMLAKPLQLINYSAEVGLGVTAALARERHESLPRLAVHEDNLHDRKPTALVADSVRSRDAADVRTLA
jgi:hypothetical protein